MFVDASALVAIITREPEASSLVDRIQRAEAPVTSAVAIFEAAMGIARKMKGGPRAARADVAAFLKAAAIRVVPITEEDGEGAVTAHERYGKGTGHPAKLNLGDCFAYAVAKRHRVPLLYKGSDFARTDLA